MGESRGGEGRDLQVSTSDVLTSLLHELKGDGRDPAFIRVDRITEGLYAVHTLIHGEREPESYFIRVGDS